MKTEDAKYMYCPFNMESQYEPRTATYVATGHKCIAEKCMAWKNETCSPENGYCMRLETK